MSSTFKYPASTPQVPPKSLIYKRKILGEIFRDTFCIEKRYGDQKNSPEIFWETPCRKLRFDTH